MSEFISNISAVFKGERVTDELPFNLPFEGVFLPDCNLIIQCIPLLPSTNVSAELCVRMIDEAAQKGFNMIYVWEDVYQRKKELVEARLLALIGKRQRIHARQTIVKRIDQKQATAFLNEHHLQQYVNAYYKYALVYKDELVAVATFSKSRVMNDGVTPYRSYELIRFASKTGTTVTGGLSKLLHYFIEQHHPAHIMTYADRDWSVGDGYIKLGFRQIGITPPQLFWTDTKTFERISKTLPFREGYVQVWNTGNLKFVLDRRS